MQWFVHNKILHILQELYPNIWLTLELLTNLQWKE